MPPHRFYLPPEQSRNRDLRLPERELHHARHVLRVQSGQQVVLLDGQGARFLCEVNLAGRHSLNLTLLKAEKVPPHPWNITLLPAVTKGKSMDYLIQKATELGAARIVPLHTEHVTLPLHPNRAKEEKWRWVAVDAMKQSGSAWLPVIEKPLALADYLSRSESFDLACLASLQSSQHPHDCFEAYQRQHRQAPRSLALWIGPEGDFTPTELDQILSTQAQPISLGSRVLRAETAALYCLSFAHYELQRRWRP